MNAPSLVVVHDKCRDSQTFVDCHSSSDQFNALKNNTYSASSSFSSTHSSYPPPSTLPPPYQHHPSSSIYAVNLSNHCFPECFSSSSSPVVLSQTKFIQSCVTPMNCSLPLPVIADYSHNNSSSTTSGNNNNNSISTVSHLTFSINDTNNNSNNNNNNNNGRVVVGDLQTIVNPQQTTTAVVAAAATTTTTTTTVTFFICEVCSSRYRSTAGLRYHYHSQHSGYTPQNPISASAARLVVPIGEERGMGVGGGLRGGRPRRHRGKYDKERTEITLVYYSLSFFYIIIITPCATTTLHR
ncbi:unnamed protein product [Trichobilharzia regenti]|nr:unnamed protein product [Trichobilharzia regenti]